MAEHAAPIGVLSYHRVAEPTVDPWGLAVSPANFASQLRTLGSSGRFVSLDRMLGGRRRRLGGIDRFAVTFDDGYADNLRAALPVLERYDVPATVFVSTGFLDRDSFWWDVLDEAVLDQERPIGALVEMGRRVGLLTRADASAARDEIQSELHAALAMRAPADVEPLVDELVAATASPPSPSGRPLTTDELVELAAHPLISIGVHTVHHVRLATAGVDHAQRELTVARDHVDRLIGRAPRALAYPHGDATPTIAALAASAGFTCAVTTDHRWVDPGDDPMLLPRLTVADVPGPTLRLRLESARRR
ncbi:MAG: polysaccharide deacetylase family protein [Ilumatobacteraceae bacterium]